MNKKANKIKIPDSELKAHLKEQISFLSLSCEHFDQGKKHEAKRIATNLRILLHDTKMSKSLIKQLGLESIHFLNTAEPYNPKNLISQVGLLSFKFNNSAGRRAWACPLGTPNKLPDKAYLNFSEWWNMPVISAKGKNKKIIFSRKDLVLHLTDTDGGCHVDDTLDENYVALSRWNAVGITTIQEEIEKPIDNPILPSIRQIAHEVLSTFQKKFPEFFEKPYSDKISDTPTPDNPGTGKPTVCSLKFNLIN